MELTEQDTHAQSPPPGPPRRRRWPTAVAVIAPVVLIAAAAFFVLRDDARHDDSSAPTQAGQLGRIGVPYDSSWPVWGFTHTQSSADVGPASEVAAAALDDQPLIQNQHIMGWGADNPEPSPGQYNFAALDRRMNYIRKTGGIPVITLCCAPDWMKGGREGDTDWSKLEFAPEPEYYDDFARLAATVARRYPYVRHFMVWNELKGFFDERLGRWDHEGYTRLYNQVYDAIKAVDPDIKVGGPYVPMYSHAHDRGSHVRGPWGSVDRIALEAVEYWLAHKRGADFLVIDGPTASDDKDVHPDEVTALDKFVAINQWLRSKTDLPIWWSEYYIEPSTDPWSEDKRVAMHVATLIDQAKTGAATVLYWNRIPVREGDRECKGCLWITTSVPDGGTPGRMLGVLQSFARWFPAGTPMVDVPSSSGKVRVLAQPRKIVAVNLSTERVEARIDGKKFTFAPYQVRWLDRDSR
ncbi:xylan 1,4-beta-xylosidase [Thermomonospora sp. CIF 1]|uniref:GH39 family glycosyl hydrolase n=1 Tax=Thermomonospora sp. CIF 1 TaxID=1916083 RepID=UPI000CAB3A68|nr:xylan 1,4-beta-xylosidase [Thermomonospora sp. CIF 1]PKK13315.1 MAG: xylan 1,4-beta-xylosidase [Thermomonospora sp. CIF 1]